MILTHTVQEEIPIFPVIPCQVLLKEGLEEVLDLVELECTEGIRLAGTDHLEMLISPIDDNRDPVLHPRTTTPVDSHLVMVVPNPHLEIGS